MNYIFNKKNHKYFYNFYFLYLPENIRQLDLL